MIQSASHKLLRTVDKYCESSQLDVWPLIFVMLVGVRVELPLPPGTPVDYLPADGATQVDASGRVAPSAVDQVVHVRMRSSATHLRIILLAVWNLETLKSFVQTTAGLRNLPQRAPFSVSGDFNGDGGYYERGGSEI